jgi:hypothetical protein
LNDVSEFCIGRPIEGAGVAFFNDQMDVFRALLKVGAWFVRESDVFFERVCREGPLVIQRFASALPRVVHLCIRSLLKFARAVYLETNSSELIQFVVSQLENEDASIQELAMTAIVAFSGRDDDEFLVILIGSDILTLLPHLTDSRSREVACLVLRNFAASRDMAMVDHVFDPPVWEFLTEVFEKDHFAAKQRAYFVISYCIIADSPQIRTFFTDNPDRYSDFLGTLIESSDWHFLMSAMMALLILVREEEHKCTRSGRKNITASLLVQAGLDDFLHGFTTPDKDLSEMRDLLRDIIDQALIYDRLS